MEKICFVFYDKYCKKNLLFSTIKGFFLGGDDDAVLAGLKRTEKDFPDETRSQS